MIDRWRIVGHSCDYFNVRWSNFPGMVKPLFEVETFSLRQTNKRACCGIQAHRFRIKLFSSSQTSWHATHYMELWGRTNAFVSVILQESLWYIKSNVYHLYWNFRIQKRIMLWCIVWDLNKVKLINYLA